MSLLSKKDIISAPVYDKELDVCNGWKKAKTKEKKKKKENIYLYYV